jgi:hypothetical protein
MQRRISPPPPAPQLELPLIVVVTRPAAAPIEKIEPYRAELDAACAVVHSLLRSAVEKPTRAKLDRLNDSILAAHKSLLNLNAMEEQNAKTEGA